MHVSFPAVTKHKTIGGQGREREDRGHTAIRRQHSLRVEASMSTAEKTPTRTREKRQKGQQGKSTPGRSTPASASAPRSREDENGCSESAKKLKIFHYFGGGGGGAATTPPTPATPRQQTKTAARVGRASAAKGKGGFAAGGGDGKPVVCCGSLCRGGGPGILPALLSAFVRCRQRCCSPDTTPAIDQQSSLRHLTAHGAPCRTFSTDGCCVGILNVKSPAFSLSRPRIQRPWFVSARSR